MMKPYSLDKLIGITKRLDIYQRITNVRNLGPDDALVAIDDDENL